jgi:outer membrane protein, adhesin transport system
LASRIFFLAQAVRWLCIKPWLSCSVLLIATIAVAQSAQPALSRLPPSEVVAAHKPSSPLLEIVRRTLGTHPQMRASRARLDAASFNLSAAEWARYPTLSADMSRSDDDRKVHRVQAQQPLWAGGRISADISSNEAKVVAATAAVRETELSLAEQVVTAAVILQKARVQLARGRDALVAYERLLDAIERRSEGGLGLQSDVTLARSRIEQARANVAQFEANERRAYSNLFALTGVPLGEVEVPERTPADDAPLSILIDEAKLFSPALARLRAESEAAEHDATAAGAAMWPQLSLRAIRTWEKAKDQDTTFKDSQILGVIEYQPGAGLGTLDRTRAAYAQKDAAFAQIDRVMREIEEQVSVAFADRVGFAARVDALSVATSANAEVIESFIRQYNIGKRTWLDVLNAQREWTDGVQLLEETRYSALLAAYRLAVLSGRFFQL